MPQIEMSQFLLLLKGFHKLPLKTQHNKNKFHYLKTKTHYDNNRSIKL